MERDTYVMYDANNDDILTAIYFDGRFQYCPLGIFLASLVEWDL